MNLDEAIKHCEDVAKIQRDYVKNGCCCDDTEIEDEYLNCANEHQQLAEWLKELKELREQTRWIPVSERLPEIQQVVLLSLRSLDVEVGFRAKTEPYFYCHNAGSCYIEPQNVLAWMPLPQPYKKSEGKE